VQEHPGREALAARRRALAEALPSGSLALLPAAPPQIVPGTRTPRQYRQGAAFRYLAGLDAPGYALALSAPAAGPPEATLFVPDPDPTRDVWEGRTVSEQEAVEELGFERAERYSALVGFLEGALGVGCAGTAGSAAAGTAPAAPAPASTPRRLVTEPGAWEGVPSGALVLALCREHGSLRLAEHVHRLRWRKSPWEQEQLRRAGAVGAGAMREAMLASCEGASGGGLPGGAAPSEHLLSAVFEFACKRRGARHLAFPPVVASGSSACTIHYSRNDQPLRPGDLVLMDAGCELGGYCSDVSRTWPVGGRFSPVQRAVYTEVLEAHQQCVAACQAGSTAQEVHALSVQKLQEGLARLGAFGGGAGGGGRAYMRFYPHSVTHWLGMDVHDTPSVPLSQVLEPGVALTIEPGLYFPDAPDVPRSLRGIGVRIEDDVLVTPEGPEVLSAGVPVEPDQLEALLTSA